MTTWCNRNQNTIILGLIIGFFVALGLSLGLAGYFSNNAQPRVCEVTHHFSTLQFQNECDEGGADDDCVVVSVAYFYGSVLIQTNAHETGILFVAVIEGGRSSDPEPTTTSENIYASNQVIYILNNTFPVGAHFSCYYFQGTISMDNTTPFYGLMIAGFVVMGVATVLLCIFIVFVILEAVK